MKLGPKLLAAPLACAVTVLAAGQAGNWLVARENTVVQAGQQAREHDLRTLADVQDRLARLHAGNFRTLALVASLDEAQVKTARDKITKVLAELKATLEREIAGDDAQLAEQVKKAGVLMDRYRGQADNALDMAGVDPNTGVAAMQQADASFTELHALAGAMLERYAALSAEASAAAQAAERRTMIAFALLGLLASAAAVAGAWWLQRRLVADLGRAAQVADAVAAGRLDAVPDVQRSDEVGDVLRALQRMTAGLRDSLGVVRESSVSLHTAAAEIAIGNSDLSARTEQAASSLQQTASAMEELAGTLASSADAARQANQLAAGAAEVARRGGSMVGNVVSTMDAISTSSKKVADIIGVIDGIAFQTNILALNAAVEAARAGEQGRGFAVVAGEVRILAQRSAQAAREIKSLIASSVEQVDAGGRLVSEAGDTMGRVVQSVHEVRDLIGHIAGAIHAQSDSVGEVNTAITQLDGMTQQNAALVEESAAAAESLKQQAGWLQGAVAHFRLGAG